MLKLFGKKFAGFFSVWYKFEPALARFYAFGLIFIAVNSKILNNNLAIGSHCSYCHWYFPGALMGRAVSPVQSSKQTSRRFSPIDGGKMYSTEFSSKSELSDPGADHDKPEILSTGLTTPHSHIRPKSAGETGNTESPQLNRSLPEMGGTVRRDSMTSFTLTSATVYPVHLLLTTNYRLPADVDRNNLERHLTDADFDAVFRMSREAFYGLPDWKRCDLKRKNHLFWTTKT